jgi:uncharacterized protein with PhoU and TrkA domain
MDAMLKTMSTMGDLAPTAGDVILHPDGLEPRSIIQKLASSCQENIVQFRAKHAILAGNMLGHQGIVTLAIHG